MNRIVDRTGPKATTYGHNVPGYARVPRHTEITGRFMKNNVHQEKSISINRCFAGIHDFFTRRGSVSFTRALTDDMGDASEDGKPPALWLSVMWLDHMIQ